MTIAIANPAQHRLESQVFEAVSLWLDEGTHRAYQSVVHAVSRLMSFFPDTSEMFFEKAGTCANLNVQQLQAPRRAQGCTGESNPNTQTSKACSIFMS